MHRSLLLLFLYRLSSEVFAELKGAPVLPTNRLVKDGKALRLDLDENASKEMFDKWMNQAVSGLMAAVVSNRLDQLDSDEVDEVESCSKSANTVPAHARCVVKVLDKTRHIKHSETEKYVESKGVKKKKPTKAEKKTKSFVIEKKKTSSFVMEKKKTKSFVIEKDRKTKKTPRYKSALLMKHKPNKWRKNWVGGFRLARAKRSIEIVNRQSYNVGSSADDTFLANIVRSVTKTVRKLKNKEGTESWRSAVQRVKYVGDEARRFNKQRKMMKKRLQKMISNTPDIFQDPRKPLAMKQMEMEDDELSLRKKVANLQKEEIRIPMRVVREAIKLALVAAGKNVTNFDRKTLKLVSPRFLSVTPEQDDDLFNLLSPSLFSVHGEGDEAEKAMSLPELMRDLPNKDQEAWLDFIMEAAGVTDAVDMTEKKQKQLREAHERGEDGTPLYFTKKNATKILGDLEKRKIETFEELDSSYNKEQRADLDKQGYAFLNHKQLDVIYGPNSPYNDSETLRHFQNLRRLHDDPHHLIEKDIRLLSEAKKFAVRQKAIVLSPILFTPITLDPALASQPIILSPLVFSPITLSPVVLGPIILSPWVFIPLILSPRVLAPLIVNPIIFSPIVLTPLVLHPMILVPGVFNPVILSPAVLSPFILSPQVFTPFVLSPLALTPLIGNPMAGSPLVLSPFVLSPIICSPQYLFSVLLSPYAMSPLIHSKLIASEVILSPSWMS